MGEGFSLSRVFLFAAAFTFIGGYALWYAFAAPNPNLQGDLNNDNIVNISDLSILLSNYGTTNTNADINHDNQVNILDLSILLSHYGQSVGGTSFDPMSAWLYQPWNANAKTAIVDPNSASMISTWSSRGNIKFPNVTTNSYSQAWAIGKTSDPHYNITITKYGHCDANVPIPAGTQPTGDSDHHLAIFDTEHNREHDMWQAAYNSTNNTWSAGSCTSYDLGKNPPAGGGSNAAGFPAFSLAIWPEQIKAGVIPHALAFSVLAAKGQSLSNPYRYPATHSDGVGDASDLPEGVWLRMPSSVSPNPNWPAWTKVVFTATQNYGMYLMDQGGTLGIGGVSPINGGVKWSDVGMGTGGSAGLPSDFPWTQMQVLQPPN